ncbi:nucleoside diphosphate kinase regulator [Devosia albogilva]|uniref:Nucleoside diphosphate kinase regulator n=1 Tax=Devosia albogilva TaxID=429726 RepID=A0ABW5QFW4_9HYPH
MTTISLSDFSLSPEIILASSEHRLLLRLAMGGSGHTADDADDLLYELERATVVPDQFLPSDTVRMGSTVSFRTAEGEQKSVELVLPIDADIAEGKISVLTPIGTALLGLRTGQSISWRTRDGRRQALTVLQVQAPQLTDEPEPPTAA